jgi:prepilin-type N-terminal cleavage/methylation domain-containing protein/prepilin-type processing-associated H-X9-DG protein
MSKQSVRRKGFTLVELLVVIGIIALLISILLPSLNRARETANRVKCGSNMRQVGQAILLYANENKGNYPRTRYNQGTGTTWSYQAAVNTANPPAKDPFVDNVTDNDVVKAMFLLIRTQDITPEVFVCPSSNDEKDTYGSGAGVSAQAKVSFTDKKNLSYSYCNPYPDANAVNNGYKTNTTAGAEFAIAADMNPGKPAGNANYDVTAPKNESSSPQFMQKGNSPNHQGQGQNVLYGDGHASFEQNPFVGTKRDNIYTVSGANDGSVTTSSNIPASGGTTTCIPKWAGDSVLLPVYP